MKVFVCSTSYDLLDVRAEVCELIKRLGYEAVAFEHPRFFAAAQDGARHDKCVSQAGKADALVAIIDQRYGAPYMGTEFYPGEKISMTWAEVRCALQNGVPVACFVRDKTWAVNATCGLRKKAGLIAACLSFSTSCKMTNAAPPPHLRIPLT